jgi:hypothetical protein
MNGFNWTDDVYKETKLWEGENLTQVFCEWMKYKVEYTDVKFMLIRGDSEHPREGLPPWNLLSDRCRPEYQYPKYDPSEMPPTPQKPWGW